MILTIVLIILVLGLGVTSGYVLYRLRRLDDDVFRIMQTLSVISPAIEQRILKRGTQVVLGERWVEDVIPTDDLVDQ